MINPIPFVCRNSASLVTIDKSYNSMNEIVYSEEIDSSNTFAIKIIPVSSKSLINSLSNLQNPSILVTLQLFKVIYPFNIVLRENDKLIIDNLKYEIIAPIIENPDGSNTFNECIVKLLIQEGV